MTSIYREGQKEDPGKYRPVSLPLVAGKLLEQIILNAITALPGQLGDQGQSAWVYQRQVLLNKSDLSLQQCDMLSG